jgi:hypothetical protein
MIKHVVAAAVVAASMVVGTASAQTTGIAPFPLSPTGGKSLPRGVPFTFKVRVDPESSPSGVFLKVSKSKQVGDDGTLLNDVYFRELAPGGGESVYSKKVERYKALTTHFLNRPGKYYWQPYVIDCGENLDDCNVEGDIHSFRIR